MTIIKQFFQSLYSAKDMASYRFQKIGRSILYVFLLSALASIPVILQSNTLITDEFAGIQSTIEEEVPDFIIKDGTLQTDDPTPIIKYSPTFTFIFDPSVTELSGTIRNSDSLFAILEDRAILKVAGQEQSIPFSTWGSSPVSKADTIEIFTTLEDMYPVFVAIIVVISYLVTCFLKFMIVTIFAYLASTFAKSSGRKISYKQGWTLIAYTLTIPTVFFFIMDMLQVTVPYAMTLETFIIFFLLFLIIREIPPQNKSSNRE